MENIKELEKFAKMSLQEISELPIERLAALQKGFETLIVHADMARQGLNGALRLKYSPLINEKRDKRSQPYGEIRIKDENYTIIENRPLVGEWDSSKLKKYAERIKDSGGNPEDFVDITYNVSEKRYLSLSDEVRRSLNEICVLRPCQSIISIKKNGEN